MNHPNIPPPLIKADRAEILRLKVVTKDNYDCLFQSFSGNVAYLIKPAYC